MPNELNTIDITDGHYYCSPGRFIGHSGFIRCKYFLFVGLRIGHSVLSVWLTLFMTATLCIGFQLNLCFLALLFICTLSVWLTNDTWCILSLQNAFVQLSLAFRNDNYTLDTRLKQAERERNLMEENTEKELEEFKNALKVSLVGKTDTHILYRVLNL